MASSCRRKRPQQLLLELEKQCTKLLSQVSALSVTHCSLSYENSLVAVLCDSFLHVQPLASGQQHWQEQRLMELLEAEGQLLQTLGRIPAVPVDEHLEALRKASVDGQGHPSISPAEDPMLLLKLITQRPPVENADRLSAMDMTLLYKQTVQELAVHLQLLDAGMLELGDCVERIRSTCDSLLHHLLSAAMLGLSAMMREYRCTDARTLGPPNFEAATAHTATFAAATSKVHLTATQEQAIAEVMKVYERLCAPLDQEILALQQQLCADEGSWSSASSISNGRSISISASHCSGSQPAPGDAAAASTAAAAAKQAVPADASSSAASSAVELTPERAAAIEAKMQQVDRLQAVQHKKRMLRVSCWAYTLGRLSWVQLARLGVLTWPYPFAFEDVCCAIQQRLNERLSAAAMPNKGGRHQSRRANLSVA